MLTAVFKHRIRPRSEPRSAAEQKLRRLLQARAIQPHRFVRHCEIGPFVVEHFCRERALVVEIKAPADPDAPRQARTALLSGMGYTVLQLSAREVLSRPGRALRRIRSALEPGA